MSKFKCNLCSRRYSSLGHLQHHREEMHSAPTEDTPITESQHSDTQNTNVYQNKQDDNLSVWKKDRNVQKFMQKYRYQYHVTMLPDLARLVQNAYLEGYWNGVDQHRVNDLITEGLSQTEDTPSRPGEHKKQELERGE